MVYYFQFGYHRPEDWNLVRTDPQFDCETAGVIAVDAESEVAAHEWGVIIARWYTASVHPARSEYRWSEQDYAVWTSLSPPEGDDVSRLPRVRVEEYPELRAMREYLGD